MGRPKGTKRDWNIRASLEERFWEKVDRKSSEECWEWKAFVHPSGYGMFAINRKMIGAHRVAWELFYEEKIPNGMSVCHHCDNRKCVNPNHLFLGTYKDNSQDRDSKNRGRIPDNRGENHGLSKLTWQEVRNIRFLYNTGRFTQKSLSIQFGVKHQTIGKIVRNKAWIE